MMEVLTDRAYTVSLQYKQYVHCKFVKFEKPTDSTTGRDHVAATQAKTRVTLSRERVLRAAVALADADGIESLTMRALGRELGVEAMSLYNHVANKDDLLDGMVDVAVLEIELPAPGADWRVAMRRRAVSAHAMYARHPWANVLIDSRRSPSPARFRYYNAVIGSLRQAGFSIEMSAHAFSVLDSYIKGFALQQTSMSFEDEEQLTKAAAELFRVIAVDYPYLAEMTKHTLDTGHKYEDQFEFGLDLILDALERIRGIAGSET